jgi:hypothetical protein
MAATCPLSPDDSVVDLIAAIIADASDDAHLVADFLEAHGVHGDPAQPITIPADVLLGLAAALRLREWERLGLRIHLDHGLPAADRALADVLGSLVGTAVVDTELPTRVMAVSVARLSWHGATDWRAAIVLDRLDDEASLDALAEFLFAHRHKGVRTKSPMNVRSTCASV